jgi:WD40 repeat protein
MDWTTPLRSLQADFIKRLESDYAILHQLNNSQLRGYHSELTVVSGEELEKIQQHSLDIADKFKKFSKNHLQNDILNNLKGKLGELVVEKYLDDLITPIDLKIRAGGDGKVDFRLKSDPSIGIQVKARHGVLDKVKWEISSEEFEKNSVLVCIWIKEKISLTQPKYSLILAGFLPKNLLNLSHSGASVGIKELLYGGGLKAYLEFIQSERHTSNSQFNQQKREQISVNYGSWKCLHTLTGHSEDVLSVAISPDGQTLATGSRDKTIKIWHLGSGELIRTLTGHSDFVLSVVISSDGQTLASCSWDKTIKIWHLGSGKLIRTLTGHSKWIDSIAISPDSQILASGSTDKTIKIWHLGSSKLLHTLAGHSEAVHSVAISPNGHILASGGDNTIKIWHLGNGKLIRTLDGHHNQFASVAFSPDGQTLAGGSADDSVQIWHLDTGKLIRTLTSHSSYVTSVAFSPDGQTLVSGSWDKTVKIWHLDTGKLIHTLTAHSDSVSSVAFSPDGQTLVSASGDEIPMGNGRDNTIKVWSRG